MKPDDWFASAAADANNRLAMRKLRLEPLRKPHLGFTLIELMIALVVVGILMMVALPAYQNSMRKSKRSEAFAAVSAVQLAQERYRANNAAYATSESALGITATHSLYNLVITTPTSTSAPIINPSIGYVVTVEGQGGQAADNQCQKMGVMVASGNVTYAGCSNCALSDLVYTPTHACWAR
jgi:type IV pilus assembly protein PilE